MSKILKYKDFFNKDVKVYCTDGSVFEGVWSEWWDEEDNSWNDETEPYESILIEIINDSVEIYADDIERIEAANAEKAAQTERTQYSAKVTAG